jgi:hypothetical protein
MANYDDYMQVARIMGDPNLTPEAQRAAIAAMGMPVDAPNPQGSLFDPSRAATAENNAPGAAQINAALNPPAPNASVQPAPVADVSSSNMSSGTPAAHPSLLHPFVGAGVPDANTPVVTAAPSTYQGTGNTGEQNYDYNRSAAVVQVPNESGIAEKYGNPNEQVRPSMAAPRQGVTTVSAPTANGEPDSEFSGKPGAGQPTAPPTVAIPARLSISGTGQMEPATTETNQTRYANSDQKALAEAQRNYSEAAGNLAEVQQRTAEIQHEQNAQLVARQAEEDARYEAWQNGVVAQLKRQQQAYQDAAQHVQETAVLDPNRWFAKKDTVDKLFTAIGYGLSAMGSLSATHGQRNMGQEFIDRQIDRDLEAQKMEFEKARGNERAQDNLFTMGMQIYGVENQAASFARQQAYELAAKQAQLFMESAKTPEQQAMARAQIAEFQAKAAAENLERNKITVKQNMKFSPRVVSVVGGPGSKEEEAYWKRQASIKKNKGIVTGEATPLNARGARTVVSVMDKAGKTKIALNALGALAQINENPEAFLPGEQQGRAETAAAALHEAGIENPPDVSSLLSGKQTGRIRGYQSTLIQQARDYDEQLAVARGATPGGDESTSEQ